MAKYLENVDIIFFISHVISTDHMNKESRDFFDNSTSSKVPPGLLILVAIDLQILHTTTFICHVTSRDYIIKESYYFVGGSS